MAPNFETTISVSCARLLSSSLRSLSLSCTRFCSHPFACYSRVAENSQHGSVRTDAELVWVLDPIDGTKSFITGKPLFGTLIGLCHHGVPMIGVIDQCVLKERIGIRGVKTELNGEVVTATGCAQLSRRCCTRPRRICSPRAGNGRLCARSRRGQRPLCGCDCYAYALVAVAGADLVVEADRGLYDYGAGASLARWRRLHADWNGDDLTLRITRLQGASGGYGQRGPAQGSIEPAQDWRLEAQIGQVNSTLPGESKL